MKAETETPDGVRTATVLFADLVGSTTLAEQLDPEDYRDLAGEAVSRVIAVVGEAGGRVVDVAGDGVLAVFDSPAAGVAAGERIPTVVASHAATFAADGAPDGPPLGVRVGVATGAVRFSHLVVSGHRRLRITGPTVDRAVELEAGAARGTASIDDATATLAAASQRHIPPTIHLPEATATRPAADGRSARDERRTIVALFVGIDALDADDAVAAVAAAATPIADVVERFGGTVKDVAGGSVVAIFGAPVAHEDDAARAVHAASAALEIAEEHGVAAKAGVASGTVVVGIIGGPEHAEYAALGDAMNTAARLHVAAPAGRVVATADVIAITSDAFDWSGVEHLQVKGKRAPLAAHTLVGVKASSRLAGPNLLVGRAHEIDALASHLADTRTGGSPVVLVQGAPGTGKTALVRHVMTSQHGTVARWVSVKAAPWEARDDLRLASAVARAVADVAGTRRAGDAIAFARSRRSARRHHHGDRRSARRDRPT
ncbi:MAG TPA: adenylate/guanylate cyclase domain-containing protein [Acidimicrobiales bacterium]|nr:adenylate/guanylate cyclase domain-containing protein [Acidimicrobiales bacterium]